MTINNLSDINLQLCNHSSTGELKYAPLPSWTTFLMNIGQYLMDSAIPGYRLVIAISLPSRAYAATFTATGLVLARTLADPFDPAEHLTTLSQLEPDTPITVRKDTDMVPGRFKNVSDKYIKYVIDRDTVRYITHENVGRIHMASEIEQVKLWKNPSRRTLPVSPLLDVVLGEARANRFVSTSCLETVIIAVMAPVKREVESIVLGYEDGGVQYFCELSELVRIKRFLSHRQGYSARIISPLLRAAFKLQTDPFAVIYDGAKSYLRQQHRWISSVAHQIVLLDRTQNDTALAANELNQRSYYRTQHTLKIGDVPPGADIMVFEEEVRDGRL